MRLNRLWLVLSFVLCVPAMSLKVLGTHAPPQTEAILFGIAILGAAFILSWAAEVAEMDMPQAAAVAILALIAVLPEYAVDLYFAWRAAEDPQYGHYAAANMTGSNRLLVGLGWPLVFLCFVLRKGGAKALRLEPSHRIEILFLGLATVYSFVIPWKRSLSLWDTAYLLPLFGLYAWRVTKAEMHEPELVGPARLIGALPRGRRRFATASMFLLAALVIAFSAESFAESLVATGKSLGMDEFLLVQWVAPLASEAPEFIVAILWTLRGNAAAGLGALVSSKVNQWTLLVGTIPVAYSLNLGHPGALPLDSRQEHELWLTACQSLFAVAVLANLRISWYGAVLLFLLFVSQLIVEQIRQQVSIVYLAFAALVLIRDRRGLPQLVRGGWRGGG